MLPQVTRGARKTKQEERMEVTSSRCSGSPLWGGGIWAEPAMQEVWEWAPWCSGGRKNEGCFPPTVTYVVCLRTSRSEVHPWEASGRVKSKVRKVPGGEVIQGHWSHNKTGFYSTCDRKLELNELESTWFAFQWWLKKNTNSKCNLLNPYCGLGIMLRLPIVYHI